MSKTPVGVLNGNWRAGDYVQRRREIERNAPLLAEEWALMEKCHDLEGDTFIAWYESDAIPAYGLIRERIRLIRERISDLELAAVMNNPSASALDQSSAIDKWMTDNWDTIPEVAF